MVFLENIWELFEIGGPVMFPIAILSAWMWILIILKADWMWRAKRRSLTVNRAMECLMEGEGAEELVCCPKAGAVTYYIKNFSKGEMEITGDADRLFFEAAVQRQIRDLNGYIPTIMVLAATAPLLGLLGTVTGMVETFRVIGIHGMGNSQAMASGIKEALITTQAGLMTAIPGLLIGQTLRKKVAGIRNEMLVFYKAVSQRLEKPA